MKKFALLSIFLLCLTCSRNTINPNCNFLLNVGVNVSIDLNLPQYNQLQFPPNAIRFEGQGNAGLIIVRVNQSTLRAWDGADPNHIPSTCSRLEINGLNATCGCSDANEYSLITGQLLGGEQLPCGLREYRVEATGSSTYLITN